MCGGRGREGRKGGRLIGRHLSEIAKADRDCQMTGAPAGAPLRHLVDKQGACVGAGAEWRSRRGRESRTLH